MASVVKEPDAVKLICLGIATGAIYQGIFAVYQRGTGVFQVTGSFVHQNTLGFMLHFVTIPLLAMLMARKQSNLYLAAVASAGVAVALSASRGSIAFVCVGIVLLFVLSLMRQSTSRKYTLIGATVGLAVLVSPIAVSGLNTRFDNLAKAGSYDERAAFEEAATMMLLENPMGVGPNQYPLAANTRGYSQRAGVAWNHGSRSANVHHMYLLMGAESGWLGMITFTAFLMWIIISGLKFAFQNKRDPVGDLVLGFTVTMIVIAVHGLYEWIFVTYEVQTIFAVGIGIIAGSIRLRGSIKQSEAHEAITTAKSESSTFKTLLQPSQTRESPAEINLFQARALQYCPRQKRGVDLLVRIADLSCSHHRNHADMTTIHSGKMASVQVAAQFIGVTARGGSPHLIEFCIQH